MEVARRASLGHKMKGMGRVYDHVTLEMDRQILEALEDRFVTSVLALDDAEQEQLLTWAPVIKDTIAKARSEAEMLAAKVVGVDLRSHRPL